MARGRITAGATQYTRSYSDFRGVELGGSGADISKSRLAYSENMYRDWAGEDGSMIESIPGLRRLASLGGRIHDIILHRIGEGEEYLLVHAGGSLYRLSVAERDSLGSPSPIATLPDEKCAHFTHGGSVYLLPGGDILRIGPDGSVSSIGDGTEEPYAPILSVNGEMHEQKNLLSDRWRTSYLLTRPNEYAYGTEGLCFRILDRELGTCSVSGMDQRYSGPIYVPAYADIGGTRYRVTEIGEKAFLLCTLASEIHVSEGIESIGKSAFYYCTGARVITLPNSLYTIGDAAFEGCKAMTDLYLGSGMYALGSSLFAECPALRRIHYAATAEQLSLVDGTAQLAEYEKIFSDPYTLCSLVLPLAEPALSVSSVTEDGSSISFASVVRDGMVQAVRIISDIGFESPREFMITAANSDQRYSIGTDGSFYGPSLIKGCTVAEVFDNRVFLSGNPDLPNTVFYSAPERSGRDDPLYFGEFNYFSDGIGSYPVCSMLSVGDSLAVFKSGDDGSGSIFYHPGKDTGHDRMPRIYPRTYVHSGICALGSSISFMDDPVFITKGGLYALDKRTINYERNVVCRSHNVNYDLQKEDLSSAILTEWMGYLVLLLGDKIYLADSRATFKHPSGGVEYEWFVLCGIGSREGGSAVFRYDTLERGDILAHPNTGAIYEGTVYSVADGDDYLIYGLEDGRCYSVYWSGELMGGSFSPATAALGTSELLFIGTESGALLTFNNDKRGIPPEAISSAADFDPEEYAATMGARIHPEFYSFEGHAVRYAIKTAYDNCGIPHMTKSTVKHSLVLRLRTSAAADLHCEVGTEGSSYREVTHFPLGSISFAEMDLAAVPLSPAEYQTLPIAEKEKRWVEKQITVYSEGYAAPIGISAIAYRYTVDGKVKRS